jgi:MFS family permease
LLVAGFLHNTVEGILESTASLFLVSRLGTSDLLIGPGIGIATVTGVLLAVRWTSNLVFSPVAGALSDRLGQPRTAALLVCVLLIGIAGAAALPGLLPVPCLALAFVAAAGLFVTLSATASGVAARSERPHLFVGAYTTATDAGLAAGPLLAYSVGGIASLPTLYLAAGGVLALAVLRYWRLEKAGV